MTIAPGPTLAALALAATVLAPPAAAQDAAAGARLAQACAACHGPHGNSTNAGYPSLAGHPPLYIHYQLILFRDRQRRDEVMSPLAATLSDRDMQDLAAYYAQQLRRPPPDNRPDARRAAAGRTLSLRHQCGVCHNDYAGRNHIPRISAQHIDYVVRQLRAFRAGTRPDIDGTMASAAQPLSDADIVDLAHYLATLR
jgi:cytochrome c553